MAFVFGSTGKSNSSNVPLRRPNMPTGGNICDATAIDQYSWFVVAQTTPGQNLTLPAPATNQAQTQMAIVQSDTGAVPFTMYGVSFPAWTTPNIARIFLWDGAAWSRMGVDPATATLIINDVISGGISAALSAEMGKQIAASIGTTGLSLGAITPTSGALTATETVKSAISKEEQAIVDALAVLGVGRNAANLGTFPGTTIPDNVSIKSALTTIESVIETALVNKEVEQVPNLVDTTVILAPRDVAYVLDDGDAKWALYYILGIAGGNTIALCTKVKLADQDTMQDLGLKAQASAIGIGSAANDLGTLTLDPVALTATESVKSAIRKLMGMIDVVRANVPAMMTAEVVRANDLRRVTLMGVEVVVRAVIGRTVGAIATEANKVAELAAANWVYVTQEGVSPAYVAGVAAIPGMWAIDSLKQYQRTGATALTGATFAADTANWLGDPAGAGGTGTKSFTSTGHSLIKGQPFFVATGGGAFKANIDDADKMAIGLVAAVTTANIFDYVTNDELIFTAGEVDAITASASDRAAAGQFITGHYYHYNALGLLTVTEGASFSHPVAIALSAVKLRVVVDRPIAKYGAVMKSQLSITRAHTANSVGTGLYAGVGADTSQRYDVGAAWGLGTVTTLLFSSPHEKQKKGTGFTTGSNAVIVNKACTAEISTTVSVSIGGNPNDADAIDVYLVLLRSGTRTVVGIGGAGRLSSYSTNNYGADSSFAYSRWDLLPGDSIEAHLVTTHPIANVYVQQFSFHIKEDETTVIPVPLAPGNYTEVNNRVPGAKCEIAMAKFNAPFEFYNDPYFRFNVNASGHFEVAAVGIARAFSVVGFNSNTSAASLPVSNDGDVLMSGYSSSSGSFVQISSQPVSVDYDDHQIWWLTTSTASVRYQIVLQGGGSTVTAKVERTDFSGIVTNVKITLP
jgi:hypothetical protein